VKLEKLSPEFGVALTGVDFAALDDDEVAALGESLRPVWDAEQVVVLRGQAFEPEDQIRFVGMFGQVADEAQDGGFYSTMTNVRDTVGVELHRLEWHYDYAFTPYPHPGISLYGIDVQGDVSGTRFASATVGYKHLTPTLRARLETLTCVNVATATAGPEDDLAAVWEALAAGTYDGTAVRLPSITPHPRTGEPMLRVCGQQTAGFEGISFEESREILDAVFDTMYDDKFVIDHEWKTGDIVFWDNFVGHHSRGVVPAAKEGAGVRSLRRVIASEHLEDLLEYCPGLRRTLAPS
jgi:alpha-ketoglutarate-dependent taurine dioxygenase